MEDDKNTLEEDLKDMGTSLVVLAMVVATKERHVVRNNVVATNPTSPSTNSTILSQVQIEYAALCDVLPCMMDGVHVEIKSVASINAHDASNVSLPEVAAHLLASLLT